MQLTPRKRAETRRTFNGTIARKHITHVRMSIIQANKQAFITVVAKMAK